MTPIDKNVVARHLEEIEQSLAYLDSKKNMPLKGLVGNIETRFAIERALQMAIQSSLDVGGHILAAMAVNDVSTLADIPRKLADHKIIGSALAERMVGMAKFRNILVHEYMAIDTAKLYAVLRNNLDDFRLFAKAVVKALKTAKSYK